MDGCIWGSLHVFARGRAFSLADIGHLAEGFGDRQYLLSPTSLKFTPRLSWPCRSQDPFRHCEMYERRQMGRLTCTGLQIEFPKDKKILSCQSAKLNISIYWWQSLMRGAVLYSVSILNTKTCSREEEMLSAHRRSSNAFKFSFSFTEHL